MRERAAGIVLLLALNLFLYWPLFQPGETPYRGSIEGGYAATTRFFGEHPNPWGWNPTQYFGLPAQFTYLPGVPYLGILLRKVLPSLSPADAFRAVCAALALLTPAVAFLLAYSFTGRLGWSFGAGIVLSLVSPVYWLFHVASSVTGPYYLPWRLQSLRQFGEGPHNAGLALMPLALLAAWRAGKRRDYASLLIAAVLMALVALISWVAALALALTCLILLSLSGQSDGESLDRGRIVLTAVLAYGLACFWLTPSFILVTLLNWPSDAADFQVKWSQLGLLAAWFVGLLTLRLFFARFLKAEVYLCFVTMAAFCFGWPVFWKWRYNIATLPEAHRYALEFDLFLVLAAVGWLCWIFDRRIPWLRLVAFGVAWALFLASIPAMRRLARRDWALKRPIPKEETVEYQLARRFADLAPSGRILATGSLRFGLNSWYDLEQVGGVFESGLTNRQALHFLYRIYSSEGSEPGRDGEDAVVTMKAIGVEYVAVHDATSRETYHDFKRPGKFEGLLEKVYSDAGDSIYRLPFHSYAHLVRHDELPSWERWQPPQISKYVAAIEDPSRPRLAASWSGPSELRIEGPVPEGMLIAVQVSWDPGWRAEQDGQPIAVAPGRMNFLVLHPHPASSAKIRLRYVGTTEQKLFAGASGLVWIGALGALFRRRKPDEPDAVV